MLNQFSNLSCYEEFEILCTLNGISKIDVLDEIGYQTDDYYFFISNDGIFNWFDLKGNHIDDPCILKTLKEDHIPVSISKCIIPNSVTRIDYSAFAYCAFLEKITIPNSVTSIGNRAFYNCYSLKEINIPNSVISISRYAFVNCTSLKEINIPNSVTHIGEYAFLSCKLLEKINISNSVTYIGWDTFYGCNSLKEVIFRGKTLDEVKQMENYPFGIEDKSIIKCEL